MADGNDLKGFVTITLTDEDGNIKSEETVENLITDTGDLYYAQQAIDGVAPANAVAPTLVNGMKLGTGTTAVAKNGAGAALVTYLTGSNQAFDASYPQVANQGAGNGVWGVYKVTYAAGVATNAAITEAVIVTDEATNATSTASNTISRITFTAVNKGASDTLSITWNHQFKGS